MEETISLQELFKILKKRIGLIIVSMFLGVGVAGIVTFFIITPKFSSQAQLIVRLPQSETSNVNDINANLQMINTYKDLITSDTVMNEVKKRMKEEYNNDLSVGDIRGSLEVVQSPNSQMFSIVSKGTQPELVQNIANQAALVFQEKAKNILSVDEISIISAAVASYKQVSPNNKLNLLIGVALGLVVGVGLAFVLELFDKTIKDDRFVSEELGFTVLGIVPNMSAKELNAKLVRTSPTQIIDDTENNSTEDSTLSRRTRPKV
ncbi:YveK family protein [Enterococcus sp. LJL99]